ncbi:hypothetical protein [Cochleicola gelatinilyticus]|uniref:Uncharacterized protein n=1 Tax=Cochleicola gelatinilyticus TaxID=1763537 RepID=A0A167IKR9_9FLAO|nr:hypothetical protein [Cochleicola gelatinilyticus]OAB79752.1 hypothetical protein ULVI_03125 [Cochleicola gelatinilyticus]
MTNETLGIIASSIVGLTGAFGLPEIIKSWRLKKEAKQENLRGRLEKTEKELLRHKQFQIEMSAMLPLIEIPLRRIEDNDAVEMIEHLKQRINANVTPAQT